MRKLIGIALMIVAMLVCSPTSYAQEDMTIDSTYWFHGKVTDDNGNPIQGATVYCTNCYPPLSDTTGADGEYVITYHSFCDVKYLECIAEGFASQTKTTSDGSCPECCDPDDYYCIDNAQCDWDSRVSFQLNPDATQDLDGDGLANAFDNCPTQPNWLQMGTCTSGKRNQLCTTHRQCDKCGVVGYCSKLNEDCDGNGIGDACDICVDQVGGCRDCNYSATSLDNLNPAHKLMSEINITKLQDSDKELALWMLYILWRDGHNYSSYPSVIQGIIGMFLNGPDKLCGECVHDFNENGICDEEEPGGLPIWITPGQYLEAFLNAFNYCRTTGIPNCDPEEDPWSCMW